MAWTLVLALTIPTGAVANRQAELCDDAARRAAAATGVPLSVMRALSRTETGRGAAGAADPWPWAVNAGGQGYWFDSKDEALRFATSAISEGRTNLDLGCFQVNVRWHGKAFASAEAMLDPTENARYAAQFLSELHDEVGDWTAAAGAYHSRTPKHAGPYRERFLRHLAALPDPEPTPTPTPQPAAQIATPRPNTFPLLRQTGHGPLRGSLVGLGAASGGRLIVGAAGPLR